MPKFTVPDCGDCGAAPYARRKPEGASITWECGSRGSVGAGGLIYSHSVGRYCLARQLADRDVALTAAAEQVKAIERERDALREVAKGYEKWEANLLLNRAAWGGGLSEFPELTEELFDELLELQAKRNAAREQGAR